MGRTIPVLNETSSEHHLLSLSLLLTCMAAAIVVSSAMCGTWSRKKQDPSEEENNKSDTVDDISSPRDQQQSLGSTPATDVISTVISEGEALNKPLPPPPAAVSIDAVPLDPTKKKKPTIDKSSSLNNYISNKPSRRKLSAGSISLKIPHAGRSRSMNKRKEHGGGGDHHHHHHPHVPHVHNIMRTKQEESLWTKKILLGEKCKLHLDDDDQEGAVSDDKGKQVDGESLAENEEDMSRTDSLIDDDDDNDDGDSSSGGHSLGEDSETSSDVKLEQV